METPAEPREQEGDHREARDGEDGRHRAEALEAEIEVRDGPREQKVERRAATLLEHDPEDVVERMPADEERQRLVLVEARKQLVVDKSRGRGGDRGHAEREPACQIHARTAAPSRAPIRVACAVSLIVSSDCRC